MIEINYEKPEITAIITYQSLPITVTVDEKDIEIIISFNDTNKENTEVVTQVQVICGDETGFSDYDNYLQIIYDELSKVEEKTREEIGKICDEIEIKVEKILEEYNIDV